MSTTTTPRPPEASVTITFDVAAHVLWRASCGGYPAGSFTTKLLDAWNLADDSNAAKLATAFPDYAAAVALLSQPGGVHRLRAIAGGEQA